jgi:hypothetical protein
MFGITLGIASIFEPSSLSSGVRELGFENFCKFLFVDYYDMVVICYSRLFRFVGIAKCDTGRERLNASTALLFAASVISFPAMSRAIRRPLVSETVGLLGMRRIERRSQQPLLDPTSATTESHSA